MEYSPTTWVNNSTPALNAANLNNMEEGITDAYNSANITILPTGNIEATNVQDAIDELEAEKESTITAHHARHETGGGDVIADAIAAGNSGLMSGADKTKIDGVEALADVTDTANVTSAGALMESLYDADTLVIAHDDNDPIALGISASEIVGRTSGAGHIVGLTQTEARTVLEVEQNADVTDAVNVASTIHGVAAKTPPIDADTVGLIDSAAANVLKKLTWANIKATLKTYFDGIYANLGANSDITSLTGLTTPLDETYGGTGLTTYTQGDVVYASGSNTLGKLGKGTADQVLTMNGGATAPEWAAASGGIDSVVDDGSPQLGGNLELNNKNIEFTHTVTSDTHEGITIMAANGNAGSIAPGDVCYLASDGKMKFADASSSDTMPGMYMATNSHPSGTNSRYLVMGNMDVTGWNWSAGPIYVSATGTTGNTLTQTAPSGTGDQIQIVGHHYLDSETLMFFHPSVTTTEAS